MAFGLPPLLGWPALVHGDAQPNPVVVVSPVSPPTAADRGVPPSMTLLGMGVGTFVLGYGPSVSVGMHSDHKGDENLLFPVVGPWLDLAHRGCTTESASTEDGAIERDRRQSCGSSAIEKAALITDGIVQSLGALQIMGAFFVRQEPTPGFGVPPMPRFAIVPTVFGAHGLGAMARGRF
jgi:hypothetical protein